MPGKSHHHPMFERIQRNLNRTVSEGDLAPTRLPLAPEISLFLLGENYPRGRLPHDEMIAIMNAPAYWAFCWASGQVLARYILDHAAAFSDKTVLDFGCGSGVVAIAAAMAGARRIVACDHDPMALEATLANAALNDIQLELLDDIAALDLRPDIAIAADVLYDRDNMEWLERLPRLAGDVLIADSRVKQVDVVGYSVVDRVTATTVPDLDELREYNDVKVYRSH
ncbi:MAG: 50S ribosomal protein L11 methyltransferase [Pseudomonadales bacterium]